MVSAFQNTTIGYNGVGIVSINSRTILILVSTMLAGSAFAAPHVLTQKTSYGVEHVLTFRASDLADSPAMSVSGTCSVRVVISGSSAVSLYANVLVTDAASSGTLLGAFSASTTTATTFKPGTLWVKAVATNAATAGSVMSIVCTNTQQAEATSDAVFACSSLPPINATPVSVSPGGNIQTAIGTACGSGAGRVALQPGTYTDQNIQVGTGGQAIAGECEIFAADPSNKPVLRATVGVARGVIQAINVDPRLRLTNLKIDGRRSSQTDASMSLICTDTTPDDGICDSGSISEGGASGVVSRWTVTGDATTCLYGVEVYDTAADGIALRNQVGTGVENVRVDRAGCTSATCPALSTVPNDFSTNSVLVLGRGISITHSVSSSVVASRTEDVTKGGLSFLNAGSVYAGWNTALGSLLFGIGDVNSNVQFVDNLIVDTGNDLAHNSNTVNSGQGIYFASDTDDYSSLVARNTVVDSWGSGIKAELSAAAPPPTLVVENNRIENACLGSVNASEAALFLGDNTEDFEAITSRSNTIVGNRCASAVRIWNQPNYVGTGTTISGTVSGDGFTVEDSAVNQIGVVTDADIVLDAGSTGSMSHCSFNGGASTSDSSGGGVNLTNGCDGAAVSGCTFPFELPCTFGS